MKKEINRCYNCKEKFENKECLIKVKQAGKIREWCDACLSGYLEEKGGVHNST